MKSAVVQHWRAIGLSLLIASVCALLFSLACPRRFTAETTFTPEGTRQPTLATGQHLLPGQFPKIGGGGNQSPEFYYRLLRSRALQQEVLRSPVRGRTLTAHLAGDRADSNAAALRRLRACTAVAVDRLSGIVKVSVTLGEPELAAAVADRFLDLVGSAGVQMWRRNAGQKSRFLATQRAGAHRKLEEAENHLREFLNRNRPPHGPSLAARKSRLQRQVAIARDDYLYLSRQHQVASLEELNTTPFISCVEPAFPPARPSSPRPLFSMILAAICAAVLGTAAFTLRYRRSSGNGLTTGFVMVIGIGILSAAVAVLAPLVIHPPALLAGILFTAFCLGLAFRRAFRNGRRHLFSPLPLVFLYMGIGIGGKGIFNLLAGESRLGPIFDPYSELHEELLLSTFLLAGLAALAYLAGDHLASAGRGNGPYFCPSAAGSRIRTPWLVGTGTVLTIIGALPLLARHGIQLFTSPGSLAIEGMSGLFWAFTLLFGGIFGWGFSILNDWIRKGRSSVLKYLAFAAISLFVFSLTSSKSALAISVILLLVGRHYCIRPIKKRTLFLVPVVALAILPLLYNYRAFGLSPEVFLQIRANTLLLGAMLFFNRGYMADSISAILYMTPEVYPFQLGKGYLELFYFWIPRALWPDKPFSSALTFGTTYFSGSSQAGQAFFTPTLIGDSYRNLGMPGVILIFLLFGYFMRRFYDICIGSRPRPVGVFLYASAVYFVASAPEGSLVGALSLSFSYLAIAFLVIVISRTGAMVWSPRSRW